MNLQIRKFLRQIVADPGAQTSNDEEEGTSGEVEGAVGMAGPVRDLSDDEDMVMMDEGPTRLIDPITMKEVVNPVRNKYCKHVYDRDTIIQYIQNSANPKYSELFCYGIISIFA